MALLKIIVQLVMLSQARFKGQNQSIDIFRDEWVL